MFYCIKDCLKLIYENDKWFLALFDQLHEQIHARCLIMFSFQLWPPIRKWIWFIKSFNICLSYQADCNGCAWIINFDKALLSRPISVDADAVTIVQCSTKPTRLYHDFGVKTPGQACVMIECKYCINCYITGLDSSAKQ